MKKRRNLKLHRETLYSADLSRAEGAGSIILETNPSLGFCTAFCTGFGCGPGTIASRVRTQCVGGSCFSCGTVTCALCG